MYFLISLSRRQVVFCVKKMELEMKSLRDIGQAAGQLQALVKDLGQSQKDEKRLGEMSDRITNLVQEIYTLNYDSKENNATLIHIHTCAVSLWNLTVAMKTGGKTKSDLNARLRHAACNLYAMANASSATESTFRKQLVMISKTGRAWLDCENPSMAESSLTMANECWDNLQKLWSSSGALSEDCGRQQAESYGYMFRVFSDMAEAAMSLGNNNSALECIEKAKAFLVKLPKENATLSRLCYNFGVTTYNRREYEDCIEWLRESLELGKGKAPVGHKKQATTLRLIANAYLKWDSKEHLQKALNAVGLANAEHPHPAGHYLKIELLLLSDNTPMARLQSAFEEALNLPDLTAQIGLSLAQLATRYKRTDLALNCLQTLATRFKNSPDLAKIQLQHVELLLQNNQDQEAKDLVEDCITGHNTGQQLSPDICKMFHLLLWEKAANLYEAKEYQEAINWYNYSLSLFNSEDTSTNKNVAKLLASKAAAEAQRIEPNSPIVHFFQFKIALMEGDDNKAMEAIKQISQSQANDHDNNDVTTDEDDAHGLICLAAQLSLEQNNRSVAVKALDGILETSASNKQVITALRCLIRLKLTISETDVKGDVNGIMPYLKKALECVNKMAALGPLADVQAEATWFMKIAWNMALDSSESSSDLREFFLICYKFADLCAIDAANMSRQKNCLLMAAAASLQIAKETSNETEKKEALSETLTHVQNCRDLCKRINGTHSIQGNKDKKDDSIILLILYEFEAKAKLGEGDASLESCLHKLIALPFCEAKTFETVAALAVEQPAFYREVSVKALKLAIKKHRTAEPVDLIALSKVFHSLAELALGRGSSRDAESKEEAWTLYQEIIEFVESTDKGSYPEMELIWLMTKAWNCGINLFSSGRFDASEKWCATAMRLLQRLVGFKTNYESKMTSVYSDILDRISRAAAQATVEE
ncbi:testis-expressed protein 11 isoform X2 [Nematostella vectensis]|uniref:testis-expressed protein 11 isoform X2 n=1 Tax=Nematostella vectensis TaxID=45351 RepID=UPI0020775692|nr:testis-expressed protein 11 isoform X2 [Nematostella vectensis]